MHNEVSSLHYRCAELHWELRDMHICERPWSSQTITFLQQNTHDCECRDKVKLRVCTRIFRCRQMFGSFPWCSSSASCQMLASVLSPICATFWSYLLPLPSHYNAVFGLLLSLELKHVHPPTHQHSRRAPKYSSKMPLTRASNCRQRAYARRVHTGQSPRGTCRGWLTWAACSLMQKSSTATSRSGMCRG